MMSFDPPAVPWLELAVIAAGLLVLLVTSLWMVVAAFRVSVLWGVLVLVVPFAAIVFVFAHWEEAKKPVLYSILGSLVLLGGVYLLRDDAEKWLPLLAERMYAQGVRDASAEVKPEEVPIRLEALKARGAELRARAQSLPAGDAAAREQWKQDTEAYNRELEALKATGGYRRWKESQPTPASPHPAP